MSISSPNIALVYHERSVDYLARLRNPDHPDSDPVLAAIVVCSNKQTDEMLEEAFQATNSIEQPWPLNDNVVTTGLLPARSTSVGDFIQIGICIYRCDPLGWTHVAPTRWQLIKSFFAK